MTTTYTQATCPACAGNGLNGDDHCPACGGTGRARKGESAMKMCDGVIDLRSPIGSERRRGFQPPYYTVYKYRCPRCERLVIVRANSFRGSRPTPGHGAIRCGGPIPGFAPTYRGEPGTEAAR